MTDTPHFEENLDAFDEQPLPLRPWEQATLKELALIIQGLCSCGYPQPGNVIFALRDVAACLEEQYVGTRNSEMVRDILSTMTGHDHPAARHRLTAVPPTHPIEKEDDETPIGWMNGQPVYAEDLETLEDEHEQF